MHTYLRSSFGTVYATTPHASHMINLTFPFGKMKKREKNKLTSDDALHRSGYEYALKVREKHNYLNHLD